MVNYHPRSICFLTDGCDADCEICGMEKNRGRELAVEDIMDVLDQAGKMGMRKAGFSGGEPFRRYPDLLSCVGYATSRGMEPDIVTNASYAKDPVTALRVAEDLSRVGMSHMCISFDKPHLKYVPKSNHLNAIRGNLAKGIDVTLYATLTKSDNETESLIEELAAELGGSADKYGIKLNDGRRIDARVLYAKRVGRASQLPESEFSYPSQESMACNLGEDIAIKSDGSIVPCCTFQAVANGAYNMGNIRENTLKSAVKKVNDSIIGSVIFGPSGFKRVRNALKNSKQPELIEMTEKKYQSCCDACSEFISNPKSSGFLLSEFEKQRGIKPVIEFDDGEMATEESAKLIADGKTVRFLDCLVPVSSRDFYDSTFRHQLAHLEEMEGKLGIDLSESKDAIKMVMGNRL
jgi:MoaA/NifB/PqqE/SkfB family radical SAM enzyme